MADAEVVTGMVLTSMSVGDYDKRITILTRERGKITAFARGAKRPNSQLLAGTTPFCFGEFEVFEGKNAYTLTKTTISNYFRELTQDPEAAYMGMYFLEFAEYYCQENADEKEMLKLLYQSLRALCNPKFDKRLVRAIFELKAMTINGEGPTVFQCIHCKSKENLSLFSVSRGGVFCKKCGEQIGGIEIEPSLRYTLQYVVGSPIEKLYTFALAEEVLVEFTKLMKQYMNHYVNHTFKSLQTMEEMFG